MTTTGSFVINGTEAGHRFPVAPLALACSSSMTAARPTAPGNCCSRHASFPTAVLAGLRIRPKDILFFRVDRRRKMPVTTLLKAIGITSEKSWPSSSVRHLPARQGGFDFTLVPERLRGEVARFDFTTRMASH